MVSIESWWDGNVRGRSSDILELVLAAISEDYSNVGMILESINEMDSDFSPEAWPARKAVPVNRQEVMHALQELSDAPRHHRLRRHSDQPEREREGRHDAESPGCMSVQVPRRTQRHGHHREPQSARLEWPLADADALFDASERIENSPRSLPRIRNSESSA